MNYFKIALISGTSGALICILWFSCAYLAHVNPFFSFGGNLVIVVVGSTVFLSLYFYRKFYAIEDFSFGQGIFIGGFATVILAFTTGFLVYFATQSYFTGALEMYKNDALQHLIRNKEQLISESNQEIYNTYLNSVPQINVYNSTQRYVVSNLLIPGLMFSVLSAIPLRRKKEKPEEIEKG